MKDIWLSNFKKAQSILEEFINSEDLLKACDEFSKSLYDCYKNEGKAISCGNGGSHCDAMHFAEELTGQFSRPRKALGALALGDPSHITCTANDYGFEHIFSRQIEALAKPEDLLIALSTSGDSKNVIEAVKKANSMGLKTIGLLGKGGGELRNMVDTALIVPAKTSDRIQEMHIKIIHTAIECVERRLFPENY